MNRLPVLALALALGLPALPAAARSFVADQAGMFSAATVADLNAKIGSFNAQMGKDVVVVTAPSLGGATLQAAAAAAFTQQNVNGVLIFVARDERRDIIVPDRAGAAWFTPAVLASIRQSMEGQFRSENYDAGIAAAVDGVLNIYRAHLGSLRPGNAGTQASNGAPAFGGFHLSMFWWIVIIAVGFFLVRAIFRAMAGPRYMGGMPPGAMPPGGTPPPGYGPGYGGYGGGGSFWTGLLGGLGGAWLGNELFSQHSGGAIGPADAAGATPLDSGGWQSDAGQADLSGASGGDWGGGGFGDSGGGFGGDTGGGGDSGGGW